MNKLSTFLFQRWRTIYFWAFSDTHPGWSSSSECSLYATCWLSKMAMVLNYQK